MIIKGHRGSDPEQRRLDRVAITAAVTMLYGDAARVRSIVPVLSDRECAWVRVRSIVPVLSDRECAWVRQGRLPLRNLQQPAALARSTPVFDRVKK